MRLRARETITTHFRIPSLGHLGPIFTHKILSVGLDTPAVYSLRSAQDAPNLGAMLSQLFFNRPSFAITNILLIRRFGQSSFHFLSSATEIPVFFA